MNIQVILTETDPKLGQAGEVIKVAPGFAQNYLIPHGKAKLATDGNLKAAAEAKKRQSQVTQDKLAHAQELAEKISAFSLTLSVQAGADNKLFGAVTAQDIRQALSGKGIVVQKKDIHLTESIKKLGQHEVTLKLHPQVTTTLKLAINKK